VLAWHLEFGIRHLRFLGCIGVKVFMISLRSSSSRRVLTYRTHGHHTG
jgi:hypothetical protein